MKTSYVPPRSIRQWRNDIEGGELYELHIFNNQTVCLASGRYAHSSGSSSCTWQEFLSGQLHEGIAKSMGSEILAEAQKFVRAQQGAPGDGFAAPEL
jgi:hypothetical protein